jgi:hypothetical protein
MFGNLPNIPQTFFELFLDIPKVISEAGQQHDNKD